MSQKSFLRSSFNPFYPLKCVLGAGENELESVQRRAFLSTAIREDPQRRSEKLKQAERSVLAVLCKIIVSPLILSIFIAFCSFACFPSPCPCLPLFSSPFFLILFTVSFSVPIFHVLSHFLPPPLLFSSSHLISTLLLLFWFI